jgi:DNA recombination protein RmuC
MQSESILLIALLALVGAAVFLAAVVLLFRKRPAASAEAGWTQALLQLQQQVTDLVRSLQETGHQITRETGSQLQAGTKALTDLVQSSQMSVTAQVGQHSRTVGEKVGSLQEKLAQLDQQIQHLSEMGRDLRRLQDILRAPKLRGGFGEQLLENLLGNVLPAGDFSLQHAFAGGEKVDAAIRLPGGLVPVDAKFPLENFQKILSAQGDEELRRARRAFRDDVRRHGRNIAEKYIRTAEGTLDLALMYVPAENVYYEAFVVGADSDEAQDLWQETLARRVFPVSPNTFSLYLSTLHMGLRGMRVEEGARRVLAALLSLKGDLEGFRESFELLAKHLINAAKNLEEARSKLERLDWKLGQVGSETAEKAARGASS